MSAREQSKFLRKFKGCVRCTSWKHGQRNCRRKQRRCKAGTEGSKPNDNHHINKAAKQKVRQQTVCSKQEDRLRSQKEADQGNQVTNWRKIINGRAAEKSSSPQQATTEDHGWTPHVISPQEHRSFQNSQTRLQRNSANSRTEARQSQIRADLQGTITHPAHNQHHLQNAICEPLLDGVIMDRQRDAHLGCP